MPAIIGKLRGTRLHSFAAFCLTPPFAVQLEAKIEVAMGRPAKYTSPYQIHGAQYLLQKDAMSRQKAAYAGALDGADGFSQRASGAAPGSESRPKEKPGRGSRKYDEQDFWEADDGGWYSGGDIVQDQEVSENVRLGGMTNDGRNVYVSKGNTWAPGKDEWLDDDLFDDEFGSQGGGPRNDADSPAKGAASSEAGDFLSWLEETETEDLGLFEEEDVPFANGERGRVSRCDGRLRCTLISEWRNGGR